MLIDQKGEMTTLLATAFAVFGKTITTGVAELYFSALQQYDLAVVRDGLSRHMQDPATGQYVPKPADIIRQIQASHHDGRPEGDEAWSMAVVASDENVTTVLTDEIQGALWAAMPLLEMGDKVAARKAFLDVYERLVRVAREHGTPAEWHVSLGHDKKARIVAIENAARLGRITNRQAAAHLERIGHDSAPVTADGVAIAGLLTGKPIPMGAKAKTRENLRKLRESLLGDPADVIAKREFERQERAKLNAMADDLLGLGDGVIPSKDQEGA